MAAIFTRTLTTVDTRSDDVDDGTNLGETGRAISCFAHRFVAESASDRTGRPVVSDQGPRLTRTGTEAEKS